MHLSHVDERRYAQFDRLRQAVGLVHAFSTRPANPSPRNGAAGARARAQMVADWTLPADRLCYCRQAHGTCMAVVDDRGPGGPLPKCDAVITAMPGTSLMTFSADCPLVLLFDPERQALGLAHASWRCTVAGLTGRVIERMRGAFGCQPRDLLAGIGPGAGPCCYEVRDDVFSAAASLPDRERLFPRRDGRAYFDLWRANQAQLIAGGVPAENVELARVCTICGGDTFYSLRREGPGCGHFALLAAIAAEGGQS